MARRRQDLLRLLQQLDRWVKELDRRIAQEVARREDAQRLMTHPGVGPLTALGKPKHLRQRGLVVSGLRYAVGQKSGSAFGTRVGARRDAVPSPWTQPKKKSALESLDGLLCEAVGRQNGDSG